MLDRYLCRICSNLFSISYYFIDIIEQLKFIFLSIPEMDPKKGSNYMEKAIEKASRLIDLLTKENG